jgi:L-alanine-DL-glutamate epimerase-like enolase superfamily enzyme
MSEVRFDEVEYSIVRMMRERPFVIASHRSQEVVNILLRVRSSDGEGIGVIAPNIVTDDTLQSSIHFLQDLMDVLPAEKLNISQLHETMASISDEDNAAKCGVDMAFHDLFARMQGKPLCDLMGRIWDRIETSITIGIMDLQESLAEVHRRSMDGFGILKLKIGLDLDRDLSLIREVRRRYPDMVVRVDCNQGLEVKEAISFLDEIYPFGIQFVEQPVDAVDLGDLCEVGRSSKIPVMADESVRSVEDIERIGSFQGVGLVNIKLAKVGGILPAIELARKCEFHGMKAMVGCMSECEASISAGLHFALSQDCVEYADLDSHLSFIDDPTSAISMEKGFLSTLPLPGLGIDLGSTDCQSVEGSRIDWKVIR